MKKMFLKRPLAFSSAFFLILLFLFSYYDLNGRTAGMIVSAVLLVISVISSVVFRKKPFSEYFNICIFVFTAVFFAFTLSYFVRDKGIDRITEKYTKETISSEYRIENVIYHSSGYSLYESSILKENGENPEKVNFYFHVYSSEEYREGDILKSDLSFEKRINSINADCFSDIANKIYLDGYAESEIVKIGHKDGFIRFKNSSVSLISKILSDNLSKDSAALSKSLLIGDRSEIGDNVKNGFKVMGISHILAISGLHLSIIASLLIFIMNSFGVSKNAKAVTVVVFCIVFAYITGFRLSLIRALFMLILFYFASFSGRDYDGITSLLSSVGLICLLSPESVFDVSLILSFLSCLGILTFSLPLSEKLFKNKKSGAFKDKLIKYVVGSFLITMGATLFALPATFVFYKSVSLISLFTNLFAIPLVTVLLFVLPISLLLSFVPILSGSLFGIVGIICRLFTVCADHFSYKKEILFGIDYPFTPFLMLLFFISLCVFFILKKKSRIKALIPVSAFLLIFVLTVSVYSFRESNKTSVYTFSDGESSSLVFRYGNKNLAFDLSSSKSSLFTEKLIENILSDSSKSIDTVVFSSNSIKKLSLLEKALSDGININRVILPEYETDDMKLYVKRIEERYPIEFIFSDSFVSEWNSAKIEYLMVSSKRAGKTNFVINSDYSGSSFSFISKEAFSIPSLKRNVKTESVFEEENGINDEVRIIAEGRK